MEATETLLKDQLLDAVDDAYYRTLREGDELMYDGRTLFEILDHLNKTYGVGDKHTLAENMERFLEKPDMDNELDLYYSKQEECQRIAKDSSTPIREADMVIQLVKYMGATGIFTKATVKFNKLPADEQTWKRVKEWYRVSADEKSEIENTPASTGTCSQTRR